MIVLFTTRVSICRYMQLVQQLMVKYQGAFLPILDPLLMPIAQRLLAASPDAPSRVEQAVAEVLRRRSEEEKAGKGAGGGDAGAGVGGGGGGGGGGAGGGAGGGGGGAPFPPPSHFQAEREAFQKTFLAFIYHVTCNDLACALFSDGNVQHLGLVLEKLNEFAAEAVDPAAHRLAVSILRQLVEQWLLADQDFTAGDVAGAGVGGIGGASAKGLGGGGGRGAGGAGGGGGGGGGGGKGGAGPGMGLTKAAGGHGAAKVAPKPPPAGVGEAFAAFVVSPAVNGLCYGRLAAPAPVFEWDDAMCLLDATEIASFQLRVAGALGPDGYGQAVGDFLVAADGPANLGVDIATEMLRVITSGAASAQDVASIYQQVFQPLQQSRFGSLRPA
eukprot:g5440.t1